MPRINAHCSECSETVIIEMTDDQHARFLAWRNGIGERYIQNALPDLPPGQREFLISHVCEECFDKMFPPDEEDDEDWDDWEDDDAEE